MLPGANVAAVTILGAGDMGTALVTPLVENELDVRLWGTERDDAIVAALRAGDPHPRLGVTLPPRVNAYFSDESAAALASAEVVVVAVTSDAVRKIVSRLTSQLGPARAIVTVAKGFVPSPDGAIQLPPQTIHELVPMPIVAVGGPAKANEVARGQWTAVTFGSADPEALAHCRSLFTTPVYRVQESDDIVGLEIAAAMKNAYAIALGIPDGLEKQSGTPAHNLRAALFPRAVSEMAALAQAEGGRSETVLGLAGVGDLQVTITSGRNRMLGERIGQGEQPAAAVRALAADDTTIEGYLAARFGFQLYQQAVADGRLASGSLRLLDALWQILFREAPPVETLWRACC